MMQAMKDEKFWDGVSRKYAAGKIADMAGYERTLERAAGYLHADGHALEIGCGTGTTALKLAPYTGQLTATDISGDMIGIARQKAEEAGIENVRFEKALAGDARFEGQGFDAVLAFNVLHLLADVGGTLARLNASLKPGGLLITKTPCLKDMNPLIRWVALPLMRLAGKAPTVTCFTAGELEAAISGAGFEIIERDYHASKGRDARLFVVARRA